MVLERYLGGKGEKVRLTPEKRKEIEEEVIERVTEELGSLPEESDEVREMIRWFTREALRRRDLDSIPIREEEALSRSIADRVVGLGFFESLFPPRRTDLIEIMMNQDGSVWILKKGEINPIPAGIPEPSLFEAELAVEKLLRLAGRFVTEAEPIASGKIPRSERLPAGARVTVVRPPIANGPYPIVNVRFYEAKPVKPERIIEWGMASSEVMGFLEEAIKEHARVMISGGTATGKTTFLSALCNYIPKDERIVLNEDPAEIFIDHPNVASLETRPPSMEGKYGVDMGELVTVAMRQTPRWLIVGEVRRGDAAVWALRAYMSDHPGLSTIHADSPKAAVSNLCLFARLDMGVPYDATKRLVARAIDLFVQLGFDLSGKRRVFEISEVLPELKHGDVVLSPIFLFEEGNSSWRKVGERKRRRR
jgi:pilus assembly protein CpaF